MSLCEPILLLSGTAAYRLTELSALAAFATQGALTALTKATVNKESNEAHLHAQVAVRFHLATCSIGTLTGCSLTWTAGFTEPVL